MLVKALGDQSFNVSLKIAHLTTHDTRNENKGKYSPKMKNKNADETKERQGCLFLLQEKRAYEEGLFKYKKWLKNKGTLISPVCHESLLVIVPNNAW